MTQLTITEALAELKTIAARIEKKRQFIGEHLMYPDAIKDPLLKDGGAVEVLKREQQAISDLQRRTVNIRTAIQRANLDTTLAVGIHSRSIAEWLAWRKDVMPSEQAFIARVRQTIDANRRQLLSKGKDPAQAAVVNVDEKALADWAEQLEITEKTLDGQLSLKNATTVLEIAE